MGKTTKAIVTGIIGERRTIQLREGVYRYRACGEILDGPFSEEKVHLLDARWAQSTLRLERMRNTHKGKRCFIIGNGPSLRKTDLSLLRNEATFGLNRIYLLFDKLGFQTTYFVSINALVLDQCAADIERLAMPKFLCWNSRDKIAFQEDTVLLGRTREIGFSTDLTRGFSGGATVTYTALQIAFYLGFSTVILIGVDHSFVTQGKANEAVVSEGDDPNHFDGRYFGKGFKWNLPDLEGSEFEYRLARMQFEADRRQVLDATVDGKLTVFEKADYASLFAS